MTKAYVVTSGSYSDYSVWCIFEADTDAQKYIELVTRNSPHLVGTAVPIVEEFDFYRAGEVPALTSSGPPGTI